MTESKTKLELELEELSESALEINVESLDPIVLQGWREMCVGALKSLSVLRNVSQGEPLCGDESYECMLANATDALEKAHYASDGDDEEGLDCEDSATDLLGKQVDHATAYVAMAYARLAKVAREHVESEIARLKEKTAEAIAEQSNNPYRYFNMITDSVTTVMPIGFALDGARKGQMVSVLVNGRDVDSRTECPSNCKFARWRTDGKPSTEPGYSARCDECKTKADRPGYVAEKTEPQPPVKSPFNSIPSFGIKMPWHCTCNCDCGKLYK
jgi:hypothetical protein